MWSCSWNRCRPYDRVRALVKANVDVIVLDSAHGHSKGVMDALIKVKETIRTFK